MVNSRFEGLLWFSERDHPVLQWEGQLSPVMEVEVEEEEEEEEEEGVSGLMVTVFWVLRRLISLEFGEG